MILNKSLTLLFLHSGSAIASEVNGEKGTVLDLFLGESTIVPTQTYQSVLLNPSPTYIESPKEELSSSSPTLQSNSLKFSSEGYFNYDPYSKWGPDRWDNIKVKKSEYFDFTKVKKNQYDGRSQSPINTRRMKKN